MLCGYETFLCIRDEQTVDNKRVSFYPCSLEDNSRTCPAFCHRYKLVAVTHGFDKSLRHNPTRLLTCIKSKWALIIL